MKTIRLATPWMVVELDADKPVIRGYLHKETGIHLAGTLQDGHLVVNGFPYAWEEMQIEVLVDERHNNITYHLFLSKLLLRLQFAFQLETNALSIRLKEVKEGTIPLKTIEWMNCPFISCQDWSFSYWREEWTQKPWDTSTGKGLFRYHNSQKQIQQAIPDTSPQPTLHACLFNGTLCCFLFSNYPIFPLVTQLVESTSLPERCDLFTLSLNCYHYRVRNQHSPLLEARVVFLTDSNGDQSADECDYQLWLNRQFPDPNPIYQQNLWYKIFCASPGIVNTTFVQAAEIITAMYSITDGLPQIPYLVGWQYDGHDTGYPSIDQVNPHLGTRDDLLALIHNMSQEYHATVSCHINVDDAYKDHPGWDEEIICRDADKQLMRWEVYNGKVSYHISHTKDVESGSVFRRLEAFLALVPVKHTVHLDAFRCTNWSWEPDGFIGSIEEFECGIKPIIAFFKQRGIDVSTEAMVTTQEVDSLGVEPIGVISAIWHAPELQIYHGKILGGGRGTGVLAWGLGGSFDFDVTYALFQKHWDHIIDQLYLGTMLYRFYFTHELLEQRWDTEHKQVLLRFSDNIKTFIDYEHNHLLVTWYDMIIARDHTRCIPLDNAFYLYSRDGGEYTWQLPTNWSNQAFQAYTLTPKGRVEAPPYQFDGRSIHLRLAPRTPVKLIRGKDQV